jgi:hypothetical protein
MGAAACSPDGGRRSVFDWQATSDTVGDTVVVRTLSGSVWGDTAYLAAEVTIGMMAGPDEYLIGDPSSIAVRDDGVIYVLDRQVPVIRSYGPDGRHLRDIGREGGGPGEYKRPGSLATLADGRLLVRDPGNGRLSLFGPDGEYLGQLWYPGGFNTSRRLYSDTAGYVHSMVLLNYGTAPWDWEFGLARIDPDAGIRDTVAVPTWDYEVSRITGSREDGSSSTSNRVPFTAQTHWSFSPLGYFVGGVSSDYRIDLFRTTAPVLRIEREWTPVAVMREEADEQRRRATHNMWQQYPGWRWNGPPIPDTKPPFRGMLVSAEGNLWVLVSQQARVSMTVEEASDEERRTGWPQIRHTEPPAFDVFDVDGRFLGHVRVPDSFRTYPEPVARGDHVWAVTRDELDVASIVRFRLELPDRP